MIHHGKQKGLSVDEVARMSSAIHASESASSKQSHTFAQLSHEQAAKQATDPVYKKFHEESAEWHKGQATDSK